MRTSTLIKCNDHQGDRSVYLPFWCRVDAIHDLTATEKLFRLTRRDGQPFGHKPGQFMQVSILGTGEAPISVCSSPTRGDYLELGVRKAGTLTTKLHELSEGAVIGLRGPFGTYFDTHALRAKDLILIAGGCGLAPMRALIQYVEDCRDEFGKVTILYGAKSPGDVLYRDELAQWRHSRHLQCLVTVDNLPAGTCWDARVGLVTGLIGPLDIDPANTQAVIVGPPIMYKYVIDELFKKGLKDKQITVSLERYMKCGVGKCGHCSIDHLYCCLDGPVFGLDQVSRIKGAL